MEDENGGQFVLEGSIPLPIGEKKPFNDYEGQRMGGS